MNIVDYIGQIIVVTLDDGCRHKGLLKLAGTNPETGEEYVKFHGSGEVYFVPMNDIARVKPALFN